MMQDDIQAVTFGLGEERFALPVTMVREILDMTGIFHIPNGPPWLIGLTDVRGQNVPLADFRVRLGLAPHSVTPATRVLVVDVPLDGRTLTLGLVVDRVLDVSSFAARDIEPAPDLGVRWRSDYIRGVVRHGGDFVVLIDAARIFADDGPVLEDGALAA